jgi:hypothetical protein
MSFMTYIIDSYPLSQEDFICIKYIFKKSGRYPVLLG